MPRRGEMAHRLLGASGLGFAAPIKAQLVARRPDRILAVTHAVVQVRLAKQRQAAGEVDALHGVREARQVVGVFRAHRGTAVEGAPGFEMVGMEINDAPDAPPREGLAKAALNKVGFCHAARDLSLRPTLVKPAWPSRLMTPARRRRHGWRRG